jgi:hypothetical protein
MHPRARSTGFGRCICLLLALGEGGAVEKTDQGEKKIPKGTIEIYLVEGTPQEVIDAAIAEFGKDHVHIFPDPGKK